MKKMISFLIFLLLTIGCLNGYAQTGSVPQPSQEQIAEYQQKILSDPKIMNSIQEISQDQDLVNKFLDPEFMNMIMSGDLEKIQDHPQFQELLNDPRIQQLITRAQKNIAP